MPIRFTFFLVSFLVLSAAVAIAETCPEAEWATGQWQGEIQGAGTNVVFRFESDEDGCLTGNFDKPDQDAERLPFSSIEVDEEQILRAESAALDFTYEGQYQHQRIVGRFEQDGTVFILDLVRQ